MTERSSKRKKRDHDFSIIAHRVVQEATGESEEQPKEPELTPQERHAAAVALYFMHYNFCRVHQTLMTTPAVASGLADHEWSIDELVGLLGRN